MENFFSCHVAGSTLTTENAVSAYLEAKKEALTLGAEWAQSELSLFHSELANTLGITREQFSILVTLGKSDTWVRFDHTHLYLTPHGESGLVKLFKIVWSSTGYMDTPASSAPVNFPHNEWIERIAKDWLVTPFFEEGGSFHYTSIKSCVVLSADQAKVSLDRYMFKAE